MLKRTPLKKSNTYLKRSPIKKKSPTAEKIAENKLQQEKDKEFYQCIWNSKKHQCRVCGVPLFGEIKNIYFDHLLPKHKYEKLRYELDNILVVCAQCHTQRENGKPRELHKVAIEKAKERFL